MINIYITWPTKEGVTLAGAESIEIDFPVGFAHSEICQNEDGTELTITSSDFSLLDSSILFVKKP